MAASIKMDELLVQWLGSDTVYENVLNLVETLRKEESIDDSNNINNINGSSPNNNSTSNSSNGLESPPSSPRRKSSSHFHRGNRDSKMDEDGSNHDNNNATAESTIHEKVTIPPFYRPPGTYHNGIKMKSIRRSRSNSFDSDQSWDGIYSVDSTTFSESNSEAEFATESSTSNNPEDSNTPTAAAATSSNTKSDVPIKEQVQQIFEEHGKSFTQKQQQQYISMNNYSQQQSQSKYLTIDNFVKITKDICNFPTFFNKPLYKRILYLWNTQDVKSDSGKLILWNEFYQSAEELDIGIDPDDEEETNNDKDGNRGKDGNNEKNNKEKKKRKSNELLDQLDKFITYDIFKWYWTHEMEDYDLSERFYRLLKKPHEDYISKDDFGPFIKELLNDHPGLEFLSNHAEFQDKYAITVITRIFYSVNKCHSGRITSRQIRRSDLLSAFQQVDEEEDINKVTRYFSYEHFYVLYCRFWELDHDRDYKITREDLLKYADQSLSHMIVDRIFDAAPRPFGIVEENKDGNENTNGDKEGDGSKSDGKEKSPKDYLTYEDFIFFMLSEEDKTNEISVRYWFSCLDVDGDGKLNNMEMRSFYALQQHRMQTLGHEHIPFEDMLCQMIDMIKPKCDDHVVVEDFLQEECVPVSGALFDALFNLNKYVQFEQRDPFQERQKREDEFETDWDRFACMDYNRLAMEEEAREEDAMEIDWVSVDDEDEDNEDFNMGMGGASEAPF